MRSSCLGAPSTQQIILNITDRLHLVFLFYFTYLFFYFGIRILNLFYDTLSLRSPFPIPSHLPTGIASIKPSSTQ